MGNTRSEKWLIQKSPNFRQFLITYLQDVGMLNAPAEHFLCAKRAAQIQVANTCALGTSCLDKSSNGAPRDLVTLRQRPEADGRRADCEL
jgi:hypothetical protein